MATAKFTSESQVSVVSGIKAKRMRVVFGATSGAGRKSIILTTTSNGSRFETSNNQVQGNIMYTILQAGTALGIYVELERETSTDVWERFAFYQVEGGVVAEDFIYYIKQLTMTFLTV